MSEGRSRGFVLMLAAAVVIAALVRAVAIPLEDVMVVAGVGESMRSPLA